MPDPSDQPVQRPSPATTQAQAQDLGPWFYEFDLGQGITTPTRVPAQVQALHDARWAMAEAAIHAAFGTPPRACRALDAGCHEGWFSVQLRRMGCDEVVGVDVREESLAKARFVTATLGLDHMSFRCADAEELQADDLGRFDLTLCFGLIYHLENPIRVLRRLAAVTGRLLLVETQVMPELAGDIEWGSRDHHMPLRGGFGLIDENVAFGGGNPEAGATRLALCPSPAALRRVLEALGFDRIEILPVPAGAHEQLARGARVVVAAHRQSD